jgi:hypothetical protein
MSSSHKSEKVKKTVDYSTPLCYTFLGSGKSSKNSLYEVEKELLLFRKEGFALPGGG